MIRKILLPTAVAFAFTLGTANAFASDPWPECVDNPACQSGGCSVSSLPQQASLGAGVIALAAAAAFTFRRRSKA